MKARGYYWCDICDDGASGLRCEHGHDARFVHVAMTHQRDAGPNHASPSRPRGVDPERGHALFAQIFSQLNHQ